MNPSDTSTQLPALSQLNSPDLNPEYFSLLVVDDDDVCRDLLERRLQRKKFQVEAAASGKEALALLAAGHIFDLILMDVMMPEMSGLELLQIIRKDYAMADLPVIMVTAKDTTEDIVQALQLGANDYIAKPIDFATTVARVNTQLLLKQSMQQSRQLAQQLEVRNQFIRKVFGRYLTEEVVNQLLTTPEGLEMGGSDRVVTILMSDLRGFSAISETLPPGKVVVLINQYLARMTDIIIKYRGTIDEFIGDAILVIFGAPTQASDDAMRAVACAIEMQLAMQEVNAENHRLGLPEVEMGIGINTGRVVVGNIGSLRRTKYGVVGVNVNLAARIEGYSVGGEILISEATAQSVGYNRLQIDSSRQVSPKGVTEAMTIYRVVGLGEPYPLSLCEQAPLFVDLPEPVQIQFAILDGIHVPELTLTGELLQISAKEGIMRVATTIAPMHNLKMRLYSLAGRDYGGDVYGKVLFYQIQESCIRIRFSSIAPDIRTLFQQWLNQAMT